MNLVMAKELQMLGSFRFADGFQVGAALLAAGRLEVESLITAVLPLTQTPAALERAAGDPTALKLQVSRS